MPECHINTLLLLRRGILNSPSNTGGISLSNSPYPRDKFIANCLPQDGLGFVDTLRNRTRGTVTNASIGIPADELQSIFEKYIQSSKTRVDQKERD